MAGVLPRRTAWLMGFSLLSACATPPLRPVALSIFRPDAELARAVRVIREEYVVPVSLDRLLANGIEGIGHATPPPTPGQVAALQEAARLPAPNDTQRVAAFAKTVLAASKSPDWPGGVIDLVDAALLDMTTGLDPHSGYIRRRSLDLRANAAVGGIGLVLRMERVSRAIVVERPLVGSPAEQAGIQLGDVLKAVDGRQLAGLSADDAADLLVGKVGSTTVVDLARPGRQQPLTMTVTRQIIDQGVHWSLLGRVVYLFPSSLNRRADVELRRAESAAKAAVGGPLEGAILDLRGNPGGVLDQVITVARDLLPPDRTIVTLRGRVDPDQIFQTAEATGSAGPGEVLADVPLIVLVDGGTTAGAEILAGALQDNRRAVIAGSPTFGFGMVQTVIPLNGGLGALKITTSRVYLPSGRALQRHGIQPDIPLHAGDTVQREAELPGSLPGEASTALQPVRSDLAAIRAQIAVLPANTDRIDPARPANDSDVGQGLKILGLMRLRPKGA